MRWPAVALATAGLLVGCGDDGDSDQGESGAEPETAWGYEGGTGPSQWSRLDAAYADCSGGSQSPIDLDRGDAVAPPRLGVAYQPSAVTIENNGHSLQATYAPGSSVELGDVEYELVQFHFHAPSEHTLGGSRSPIEFHLVHEANDGSIAVLGALGHVGEPNRLLAGLGETLPERKGEKLHVRESVNALDLLPSDPGSARRWSYEGSLTTPPCTEGVHWTVFDRQIELSERQLSLLTSIHSQNNRPLQPLGARKLLVGR